MIKEREIKEHRPANLRVYNIQVFDLNHFVIGIMMDGFHKSQSLNLKIIGSFIWHYTLYFKLLIRITYPNILSILVVMTKLNK